jgi:hypothetical protein
MRLLQPELNRLGAALCDNRNQFRPGWSDAPDCPKCVAQGLWIIYGLPEGSHLPSGCTWGGCVIADDAPKFACSKCGATWGSLNRAGQS